jgi:hypothetical protein
MPLNVITYKGFKVIEDPLSPGNPKPHLTAENGGDLIQNNFVYSANTLLKNNEADIITAADFNTLRP